MKIFKNDWIEALHGEFNKDYYKQLESFIDDEYKNHVVYPSKENIYNALNFTALNDVKVLLMGQDPYYNENQAHGLSFSVTINEKIPKSLNNIYKELHNDLNTYIPNNGYLKKWADQGVLLLNTVLTVRAKEPTSHCNKGWEIFTDKIIEIVNMQNRPIVIFLWGKPAQKKRKLLTNPHHLILESPHPSPLSAYRGFWGCKCFSKCNDFFRV